MLNVALGLGALWDPYWVRDEAPAAVDFGGFWTSLWCATVTPEPAVRNQENTEKNSRPLRGHGPIPGMGLMLQHQ